MIEADKTPLCPPFTPLMEPEPSVRELLPSLAADEPEYLRLAPSAMAPGLARGKRERPPSKRPSVTHSLTIKGAQGEHTLHVSVGHRPDGTVREFFIDIAHKEGAPLRAVAHVVATSNSLALQYGAPLRSVCSALRVALFEPAGDVEGHPTITHADSLCDLVAQVLEDEDAVLREELARERAEKALQRTLRPVAVIATNGRFDADAWLFARGVHGIAVRSITEQYGVSPAVLLSRQRSKHVTVARRAAVAYLTEQGMSTPEIGRFLRRDHTTILETLRAIGMRPAGIKCGQRKAAA